MQQSGEHRIAAPISEVWRALNDPEVLARCIDGCEQMERVGEGATTFRYNRLGLSSRTDASGTT